MKERVERRGESVRLLLGETLVCPGCDVAGHGQATSGSSLFRVIGEIDSQKPRPATTGMVGGPVVLGLPFERVYGNKRRALLLRHSMK